MSTLPAASSFSGSAVSAGTIGCTSRPTARKSPCAIAEYSAAWSALGNQSSITVNGFTPGAESTSCLLPHAPSATAHARHAAASRRGRGARLGQPGQCVSPRGRMLPGGQPALGDGQGVEAGDREHEQHRGRRVRARCLEAAGVGDDLASQPRIGPGGRRAGLGDERADHPDRQGDPRAAEGRRQRGRQLGEAERLPAGGVERAQQLRLVGVHGRQAVDGRDEHREEADQRDHDQLGEDPEAPPEDQQHADHRDRHRLGADRERVDRAAQQRREVDRHRQRKAARRAPARARARPPRR